MSSPGATTPPRHPDALEEEEIRAAIRLSEAHLRKTLRRAGRGDALLGVPVHRRMDPSVYTIAPQAYLVQPSRRRRNADMSDFGLLSHRRVLTAESADTMEQVRHGW
jgi:hypothetical protein